MSEVFLVGILSIVGAGLLSSLALLCSARPSLGPREAATAWQSAPGASGCSIVSVNSSSSKDSSSPASRRAGAGGAALSRSSARAPAAEKEHPQLFNLDELNECSFSKRH